ncbi:sodium-coupled monocarboxylate transporter 1 [Tribolium castaneum]|uniref:Sodium-dependent multivitamin transporter-like Protein n=1 Tax=Tribolium castaneum TaxID=7070 RepID=D6WN37_TRICA|nr:PREDICTED: sodium-coupled monocarboxylate transporter 1 [Tribolium castaneum]EFA03242.2 Putative sodium-dependent multivitamin transporter-like Protein [Tribolium castaneum]|eukprot:XP_008194293.1 PREDICTED: sodium-coupled monocarboxylate transporter 1 [Tribolium castaneum]
MAETALDGILSMDMGERVVVVPGLEDVVATMQRFVWQDYVMFVIMLMVCMVIGVYFGFYHASTNAQEYLMGSRNMQIFPITMSLIASFVSGISILGIPTETYLFGVQYIYCLIGLVVMSLIMNYIYLPVFYGLTLTSTYEYLERRFDKHVRLFGSLLFTINMTAWLPIVIYVPALAFNQVTGVNVHFITPILCIICIFYTSLGGLKAVVWTDVIQAVIMFGAMILVAVKGTLDIGGLNTVITRSLESGRIEGPNLDFSLSTRYTFWSLTIGGCFYFLQVAAINQNMIQRYLALPSLKCAKKAVWFFALGLCAIVVVCSYCGILIYATFHNCDPLTTKLAREKDQLMPLLVMQVLGEYPGLSGIFIAGILSASLSSLSTGLNAMAAVILEDFYHFFFTRKLTEEQSSVVMKLTVIIFGAICVGLVYIIEHLGAVLQISMSIGSIASGSSLGMFTMGILLPWVNAKGALIGGTTSLIFMGWVGFQAQASIAAGDLSFPEKPLTTEGCHYHFIPKQSVAVNIHINATDFVHPEEKFILHHVSYLWYTLMGTFVSVVIGLSASFITKPLDPRDVDPALIAPILKKIIKPREFPNEPGDGIIYAFETPERKNVPLQTISQPE